MPGTPTTLKLSATLLIAVLFILSGCDQAVAPVENTDISDHANTPFSNNSKVTEGPRVLQSLDDKLAGIVNVVPGFGGFFLDADRRPTVFLKSGKAQAEVVTLIGNELEKVYGSEVRERIQNAELQIVQADYDFAELQTFRIKARELLGVAGVHALDIDERINKVAISISDDASSDEVQDRLTQLDIPSDAIIVIKSPPVVPFQSLTSQVRPTVGGLQIGFTDYWGTDNWCTMGFNARYQSDGYAYFVVNSHCTEDFGIIDGMVFRQPEAGSSDIGYEVDDYGGFTGYPCPSLYKCRYSDSALARYYSGVSDDFGGIAKTTSRSQSSPGSSTISSSFNIVSYAQSHPYIGLVVNKVGARSGWTYGPVSTTCQDHYVNGTSYRLLCQFTVNGWADHGDSGSPVFQWPAPNYSGDNIRLEGILWGGIPGTSFSFSHIGYVKSEIGNNGLSFY